MMDRFFWWVAPGARPLFYVWSILLPLATLTILCGFGFYMWIVFAALTLWLLVICIAFMCAYFDSFSSTYKHWVRDQYEQRTSGS